MENRLCVSKNVIQREFAVRIDVRYFLSCIWIWFRTANELEDDVAAFWTGHGCASSEALTRWRATWFKLLLNFSQRS